MDRNLDFSKASGLKPSASRGLTNCVRGSLGSACCGCDELNKASVDHKSSIEGVRGDLMAKNGSLAVNKGLVVASSNGWLYVHGLSSIVAVEQFSTVSESKLQRASTSLEGEVGVTLNAVPTAKTRLATVLFESGLFFSAVLDALSSVRPDKGFFMGL